nr:MAG TPA: hypothetical protein [Caudoviricetes sp.]DAI00256.1 MAG TPA: hypothetical protein [Caudoviricetes sp.]DAK74272.1 MAG TPA: hypothetical protein [Caudoviricetes sp.]
MDAAEPDLTLLALQSNEQKFHGLQKYGCS